MGVDARMQVRTAVPIDAGEVKRISVRLASSAARGGVSVIRPGRYMFIPEGRHALEIVEPVDGCTCIEVHMSGRYYGPGYERGHLPDIILVAEFLERNIPGAEIWYGGDCGALELFDKPAREALIAHFASDHGNAYFERARYGRPTAVMMCDFCDAPMNHCRVGVGGDGFVCQCCELHVLKANDGSVTQCEGKWPDTPTPAATA